MLQHHVTRQFVGSLHTFLDERIADCKSLDLSVIQHCIVPFAAAPAGDSAREDVRDEPLLGLKQLP